MANGGKDVRLGDDKRPVSIIPSNEDRLYNIANGEILTDEFGTPLITKVDQFFLQDASAKRSTSIAFPQYATDAYGREIFSDIDQTTNVTYNVNYDVSLATTSVLQSGGGTVGFGTNVALVGSWNGLNYFPLQGQEVFAGFGTMILGSKYPHLDVKTVTPQGGLEKHKLYYPDSVGIATIKGVRIHDKIVGPGIPDNTQVINVLGSRLELSNNIDASYLSGITTSQVNVRRAEWKYLTADNVWKVEEQFRETSEVSTTLLGIPRAETQLSLFSNVSSYGLNNEEFEFYTFNGGISFGSWDTRANKIYGNRYNASRKEEVQESAIRLEAFPVPYSYPFGPKFARLGYYDANLFNRYLRFIQLGNHLYDYYATGGGSSSGYPADWKDNFLNPAEVFVQGGDVVYAIGIKDSFAKVDTWTETWRDIAGSRLIDPTTNTIFNFGIANSLGLPDSPYGSDDTQPGYSNGNVKYSFLQSRRVFRYQPGRISGFTFGLKSSTEPVSGIVLEWGIKNPTDQYVFQIDAGQLKIIRRSTIPLPLSALKRSGLTTLDQVRKGSGDPFDNEEYWTIEIPRDKFNGDPLTGNGPSGYLIQPNKVTMYKIEFGWYGAIGARFYAYIPAGNGEARWVVVHTLVIENSIGSPCLEDSFFRLVYSLNISKTSDIRTPQFLYKYGASYYIDGGDEGTSTIFSASSRITGINNQDERSLLGITPKDFILNSIGVPIKNKKLIIPTTLNITSDSLAQVKVVRCRACPGFGHVYTPGIGATTTGRTIDVQLTGANQLSTINNSVFLESDIGSKVIAPTIWDAYIDNVSGFDNTLGGYINATIKGYNFSYPNRVDKDYNIEVYDPVVGIVTTNNLNVNYPHNPIRLSAQDNHYAASNFKFTGSKIEIQFLNPVQGDSYSHFADFTVGLTNFPPQVQAGQILDGFVKPGTGPGAGLTTVLKDEEVLYAEHSHRYAYLDENGTETGEAWGTPSPPIRMGLDYRIPRPPGAATGICSKVTVDILDTSLINGLQQRDFVPNASDTGQPDGNFYIFKQGEFPTGIDFNGGQIKIAGQDESTKTYVGEVKQYFDTDNNVYNYIQISGSLGNTQSLGTFSVEIRPVKLTATGNPTRQKLFNFNPFPLYFFAKFADNAALNNLTIKETSGKFQRTITPELFVRGFGTGGGVTNAGGNASSAIAPTNFEEITRLSSALVDEQNKQKLRPSTAIDTLFVGANSTIEIDMSKIFGPDRNVITPDNQNIEATFLVAKKLDGASGEIEATLNFKEQ